VQQPAARSKAVLCSKTRNVHGHLRCKLCNKNLCYSCCSELHDIFTQFLNKRSTNEEERHFILSNHWYIYVGNLILHPTSFNNATIPVSHCCSFTSTIGKQPLLWVSLFPSPQATIYQKCFSPGSSSDSDSKYLPDKVFEKITKLALKRKTTTNCFALDFLHIYHDLKVVSPLLPHEPPLCPIKGKKHKEKRAKARKIIAQGSHLLSVLACSSPTSVWYCTTSSSRQKESQN